MCAFATFFPEPPACATMASALLYKYSLPTVSDAIFFVRDSEPRDCAPAQDRTGSVDSRESLYGKGNTNYPCEERGCAIIFHQHGAKMSHIPGQSWERGPTKKKKKKKKKQANRIPTCNWAREIG
jgi:hypothetical protein